MTSRGRPTKLTQEVIAKAKEYVTGGYLAEELVPTIAGLADYIDIRKSTVYEWSKENSDFSDFCEAIMRKQEKGLLKGGMTGDYNSTITKLMLTKHGYSDKQETELSGPGGTPISIAAIDATKLSTETLKEIMAARDAVSRG